MRTRAFCSRISAKTPEARTTVGAGAQDYSSCLQTSGTLTSILQNKRATKAMISINQLGLCFWLVLWLQATSGISPKGLDEHAEAVIAWVKSSGGTFHQKLEVRRHHPDELLSPVGIYATGGIRQGETLMSIPRETLITDRGDDSQSGGLWCPTAFALIREMRLGNESKYAPYVNYLLTQPRGQLPTVWSKAGRGLLREIVGQDDDDYGNDLPPRDVTGWITKDWYQGCNGTNEAFSQNAAMLLVQRGWDDLMVPLYDMMSHRNGKWLNADCDLQPEHINHFIFVRSARDILDGEQIYTSYNLCEDCDNRQMGYGTPEILRDYGFIEQYPQRWFFRFWDISFELDEDDSGGVHLLWLSKSERGLDFLVDSLERLAEFEEVKLEAPHPSISKHELNVIGTFLNATINAVTLALLDLDEKGDTINCTSGDGFCNRSLRYDDLGWEADDVDYFVCTCNDEVSMSFESYEDVEQ